MNKQTLQAIIDDAPDGATHYGKGYYYTFSEKVTIDFIDYQWREWKDNKSTFVKTTIAGLHNPQSLDDLRQILALTKELEEVKELNTKLVCVIEKMDDYLNQDWFDCGYNKQVDELLDGLSNFFGEGSNK